MPRHVTLLAVALFTVACAKSKETDRFPLAAAPVTQAAAVSGTVSGTLLEQIPAADYVYLRLKTANGDVWAAVNQTPLTIGAQVTVNNAIVMEQFASKTLNRTFDRIYFGALDAPGGPSAGMAANAAAPTSVGTPPAAAVQVGKVEKATGADARTIGELWTQQDERAGKTVTIRGVVVKYNAEVMGKNWLHLQDGSGDAAKGTHDITVTSMDAAVIGTTVTITGTVRTKKDFGAGYTYPLIVEDAKVVVR